MTSSEIRLLFLELEEIKSDIKEIRDPAGWIDIQGAVKYSSCSRSTILRGIRSRKLKHAKTGGKIMIKRTWLDQWLTFGHGKRLTPAQRMELDQ